MADQLPTIKFHLLQPYPFANRRRIKSFIIHIFKAENTPLQSLLYIFCSDEYLLQLNIQFLQHDTFTDIITFPLSEHGQPVIAEIYISFDRIRENSTLYQTTLSSELQRIMFHGALHLCGYTDKDSSSKADMTDKEDHYLLQYNTFISRGTL